MQWSVFVITCHGANLISVYRVHLVVSMELAVPEDEMVIIPLHEVLEWRF
jgi:hypothetical protein